MKVSEKTKATLINLMQKRASVELETQAYLQGCMDCLGLEGDWNLDTKKWVFTKVKEK